MFQTITITDEQAQKLLAYRESYFLDFKDRRIAPGSLTKSLSSFCNADGGDLYIAVSEDDQGNHVWDGFPTEEEANGHIQAFNDVSPFGEDMDAEFLACSGRAGLILHVSVRKSRSVRKASDGRVYRRLNASNQPVTSEEAILALRRLKGIESFETETVPIDHDVVTNSTTIIGYLLEVVPTAEPETYLRGQQLLVGERPTVAAVLLFADEPQAILPKRCAIKIYRYSSDEASRDRLVELPITVEGNLYLQIFEAVQTTQHVISQAAFLDSEGLRRVTYPPETLHEIITNAVLHRDYSIADDIHVRIFENRVEVESPGRLPGHITPANILDERLSRNPFLVRHLNRFPDPPNKDVGEGLNTAFEFMRKMNLKEPLIQERTNTVLVSIKHEPLASPAQQVVEFLKSNPKISNSQARKLTGVDSESKMQKIFVSLQHASEIEHVPGTANRGYAYRSGPATRRTREAARSLKRRLQRRRSNVS